MALKNLREYLQNLSKDGIALAFSGGVDSTLLLAVLGNLSRENSFRLEALTMNTVLQSSEEIEEAKALSEKFGVEHRIFAFNPFSLEEVRHNRIDRCYHCKKAIFGQFAAYAEKHGLKYLLDGTNADDFQVYRPGRKALKELGVISPLAELGITKAQIRKMSAELGLPTASKPAAPCLATRFKYNTLLSAEMINQVAEGEELIKKVFPEIRNIRLRVHGKLARIEIDKEYLAVVGSQSEKLAAELKSLGFEYVTLDLEGFRSGSFDSRLKQN